LEDEHFGLKMCLEDRLAVISAPNIKGGPETVTEGTVTIFWRSDTGRDWYRIQTLEGENVGDHFGRSLGLYQDHMEDCYWLVIGAAGFGDQAHDNEHMGKAYVYMGNSDLGQFNLMDELLANDGSKGDHFGFSSDINMDLIVVGANYHYKQGVKNAGSGYIFLPNDDRGEDWIEWKQLTADCPHEEDFLGASSKFYIDPVFPLQPGGVLMGAPGWDLPGALNAGAVLVFRKQ